MQEYGAQHAYCRRESESSEALPPAKADRKSHWWDSIPNPDDLPQLRLYLQRFEQDAVLFSGGQKTTNNPRDCPQVSKPFTEAGAYSRRLNEEIGDTLRIVNGHLRVRLGPHHTHPHRHDFQALPRRN